MPLFPPFVSLFLLLLLHLHAASAQPTWTALTNNVPVLGSVAANSTAYFTFTSSSVPYTQTTLLSLSALTGFPSLYVSLSSSPLPSHSSFAYAASWLTGGVVSIVSAPPLTAFTAYIAATASAYSASNFTLVATSYNSTQQQSSVIPLYDAQPQASALAAGEYRYYAYSFVTNDTLGGLTFANTAPVGNALLAINGPNTTALPTLTSHQWSSPLSSPRLVHLPNATGGVYSVGVWSNVSSVFSLIAAHSTPIEPMQLGVVYPGAVLSGFPGALNSGVSQLYSAYLDPLLRSNSSVLSFSLLSPSSVHLYCSNNRSVDRFDYQWKTDRPGQWSRLNLLDIPTSELPTGPLYCLAYTLENYYPQYYPYTLSASTVQIPSIDPTQPVMGETGVGQDELLYSFVFEGNSSDTGAWLTVTTVASLGSTLIHLTRYGTAATLSAEEWLWRSSAVRTQQVATASICGPQWQWVIPGTSPPLCQLNIAVGTKEPSVFRLSVSRPHDIVGLVSGQPIQGFASSTGAAFTFNVPQPLSNLTLLISVLNGATDVSLSVAPGRSFGDRTQEVWSVSQQTGEGNVVFQLTYLDPLLSPLGRITGDYVVLVSSQQGAAFTVLYTVAEWDGSVGSIVRLVDGVPYQGQLTSLSDRAFFFFTPISANWPYSVTIAHSWQSGNGRVAFGLSDGTLPAPIDFNRFVVSYGGRWITQPAFLIVPNSTSYASCAPNATVPDTNHTCGYALAVSSPEPREQYPLDESWTAAFTITITTGKWERSIYANADAGAGVVQPQDWDYWVVQGSVSAWAGATSLLVLLTANTGEMALYAGNATQPNATSARWALRVESTGVLTLPLNPIAPRAGVLPSYFLTVVCLGQTLCDYALRTVAFAPPAVTSARLLTDGRSLADVVPAGQMAYYALSLRGRTSPLPYVVVELSPTLGSPSMYVTCGLGVVAAYPNETAFTWKVEGPGSLVLALTSAQAPNLTQAQCGNQLLVGVRAVGYTAVFQLSATTAGQSHDITGVENGGAGVVTPSSPASYFSWQREEGEDPQAPVTFVVIAESAACLSSLQLLVSANASVVYPSADEPGVTFDFRGSVVQLTTALQVLSVTIDTTSEPVGSQGYYHMAVIATDRSSSCQFQLQVNSLQRRELQLGLTTSVARAMASVLIYSLEAGTAVDFFLSPALNGGVLMLYVAVDATPVPSDNSTYALVFTSDTSLPSPPPPLHLLLPDTLCPLTACAVVLLAVSNLATQPLSVYTASSLTSTWLALESQLSVANASSSTGRYFQFHLPAEAEMMVTLSVRTAVPVDVVCSYRFMQPDGGHFDWSTNSSAASYAGGGAVTTALAVQWNASLVVNADTALASMPRSCYCALMAVPPYSLGYAAEVGLTAVGGGGMAVLEAGGISRGVLAAVVVGPLLAVALVAALGWRCARRGGGCRRWVEGAKAKGTAEEEEGWGRNQSHFVGEEDSDSTSELPMGRPALG